MNSAQLVEHKAQSDTHENPGVGAEAACRKRMKSMYPKKKKKKSELKSTLQDSKEGNFISILLSFLVHK